MAFRQNNIFIAFALWIGSWTILGLIESVALKIQLAALPNAEDVIPYPLETFPILSGILALLLLSRIWNGSIFLFFGAFICFDVIIEFLNYTARTISFLTCKANDCSWLLYHEPFLENLLWNFLGYFLALSIVRTKQAIQTNERATLNHMNPADLGAAAIAAIISCAIRFLEIDTSGIADVWRRWSRLPLWRSGSLIAKGVRTIAIPFIALTAAQFAASMLLAQLYPLRTIGFTAATLDGLYIATMYLLFLIVGLKCGQLTAEFQFDFPTLAVIPSFALVNYSSLLMLSGMVGAELNVATTDHWFSIAEMFSAVIIWSGFLLAYKRSNKPHAQK
jgi:hypothetical protein